MCRLLVGMCLLALAGVAVRAADDTKPQQKPGDMFKELVQKYRAAKPADRPGLLETYSQKFLDYAKNSKDDSGLDALNIVLKQLPPNIKGNPQGKATELLKTNYVNNKEAPKAARAKACTIYLGAQEAIVSSGRDAKAVAAAKKEMAEVRKLASEELKGLVKDMFVGAPMPDLKSKNLEGKDVKLSDLKGKVVMLDIWATWCPPCRAMIPHSKKMVEKLKGKPFVLVGVSADAKKETLTSFMEKNEMPWTHWWNGASGGILAELGITAFPTIYLVDHDGVIRNKWIGSPGGEVIDQAVEALVKEAEDKTKGKTN
jgi:thiol-disulfide isomerase/thioredoxin